MKKVSVWYPDKMQGRVALKGEYIIYNTYENSP